MYYMMERIRFHCKYGGRKQTDGSHVTGCPVYVFAHMVEGKMVIRTCKLEHNHPLDPKVSRLMVNYRCIDDPTTSKITNNDKAGISIAKSYNALVVESGGYENITYNQKDVRNVVHVNRRKSQFEGDAVALEKYFQQQFEHNNLFYSAVEKDGEGRLMNAFWCDPRSRAMFKDFGDIITFDTTFLCNRYRMPFAPFVGASHHGKSIVFAAAIISHEDTESFVWVFNQWMKCMGSAPKGILTDQCKAIGMAVETMFVGVPHRFCLWHILQNASRNLGMLANWKDIEDALRNVVHDCLEPNEFDEAWGLMLEKLGIQNNSWLKDTFEIRERWAPGYWRSTFWAGMSSTQRSERMNRFFKYYMSIETGLHQFILQYEAAMKGKAKEEKILNFNSAHKPPRYDKDMIVEYVFHKAYTNAKFLEVREECAAITNINVSKITSLGAVAIYKADEKFQKPIWKKKWKSFNVSFDKVQGEYICSCKLFKFTGILCRHIIKIIEVEDVDLILEKYILSRWRKDIVRGYEDIKVSYYDPDEFERVKKVKELSHRNAYLTSLALHNDETFFMYKEATDNVRSMLEDAIGIGRTGGEGGTSWDPSVRKVYGRRRLRPKDQNQRHLIKNATPPAEGATKDPVDKRHTGRGTKNRKLHPSEKGANAKKRKRGNANEHRDEDDDIGDDYTTTQTQEDVVQRITHSHPSYFARHYEHADAMLFPF